VVGPYTKAVPQGHPAGMQYIYMGDYGTFPMPCYVLYNVIMWEGLIMQPRAINEVFKLGGFKIVRRPYLTSG
jgi:hypothetical protein